MCQLARPGEKKIKETRCQFDRTEKEEKGGGTPERSLQMYFADHCNKSFRPRFVLQIMMDV